MDNENKPIMFVLNPEGLVHWAGQPRKMTAAECREWLQPGWHIETVPFKQFKEAGFKWIYDKSENDIEDD